MTEAVHKMNKNEGLRVRKKSSDATDLSNKRETVGKQTGKQTGWLEKLAFTHLVTGSILSAVSCVMCNKKVMSVMPMPLSLTTLHFGITTVVGLFKPVPHYPKKKDEPKAIMLGAAQIGFSGGLAICVMNLSLGANSVAFYQLTKVTLVPFMVVVNYLLYGTTTSIMLCISLAIITVGLVTATVTDAQLGYRGFILGVIAVLCTVLFQLSMEKLQRARGIQGSHMQLMIAPWQLLAAVMLAASDEWLPIAEGIICKERDYRETTVCAQLVQPVAEFLSRYDLVSLGNENEKIMSWNRLQDASASMDSSKVDRLVSQGVRTVLLWTFLSCLSAQLTNYYCYTIIGKFSALTYQIIAHTKTILVLTGGLMLFSDGTPIDDKHILGLVVTVLGIMLYSYVKMKNM